MDYALEAIASVIDNLPIHCFNPCSNGLCSRRVQAVKFCKVQGVVSILVLMDYALEGKIFRHIIIQVLSFNPCSNGLCSRSFDF
jgi:hypothetical protein